MIPLKQYLADALSFLRVASLLPVIIYSVQGEWGAAFFFLLLGWATDLVDGLAARRWGTVLSKEFNIDGKADAVLAFGSSIVPVVYAYHVHHVFVGIALSLLYAATVYFGTKMALSMNKPLTPKLRRLIAGNMIILHGAVQIGATLVWFCLMATTTELAVCFVGALLTVVALQYHKIHLWWNGRFEPESS